MEWLSCHGVVELLWSGGVVMEWLSCHGVVELSWDDVVVNCYLNSHFNISFSPAFEHNYLQLLFT